MKRAVLIAILFVFVSLSWIPVARAANCEEEIKNLDFGWPLEGDPSEYVIILDYGVPWRNDDGHYWGSSSDKHLGIDIKLHRERSTNAVDGSGDVTKGKKVYASRSGLACYFSLGAKWGTGVLVQEVAHQGTANQYYFFTLYEHITPATTVPVCDNIFLKSNGYVETGVSVGKGDLIGTIVDLDNGHQQVQDRDHLHLAVRCNDAVKKCGGGASSELAKNGGNCTEPKVFFPKLKKVFPDVKCDQWYFYFIHRLVDKGILEGIPETGLFLPDNKISRAALLKIIVKSMELSFGSSLTNTTLPEAFKDGNFVADGGEGQWFIPYVQKALDFQHQGETLAFWSDFKNSTMGQLVTRAEMARLIYIAKKLDYTGNEFTDLTDIASHPLKKYIIACQKEGYLDGNPNKTFDPDKPVNRAAAAKIIYNAFFSISPSIEATLYFGNLIDATHSFYGKNQCGWI